MNQAELQELTHERIKDAEALIRGKRWAFAYYVSGYAVECALKSCVLARMIHTGWVFREKVKIAECLTHDFDELIRIAGMTDLLKARIAESSASGRAFVDHWETVSRWSVADRYDRKSRAEAIALRDAIVAEPDGVLQWIMNHW